jgi:polyisoprenoid-binding protein YceI
MNRIRNLSVAVALVTTTLAAGSFATSQTKTGAKAVAHLKGTAGIKFDATTSEVSFRDKDGVYTVFVRLQNLTTGIDLRDAHMRDKYLHVEKFPVVKLEVSKDALKKPAAGETVDVEGKGKLTLHGVTKDIAVKVHAACTKENVCDAVGKISLNFNDYGVTVDSYLGITLKPDVEIETTLQVLNVDEAPAAPPPAAPAPAAPTK